MSDITIPSRDLTGLPIDERGHMHIHGRFRNEIVAEQSGLVRDGGTTWFKPQLYGAVFSCHMCDAYPSWAVVEDDNGDPVSLAAASECSMPDGLTTVIELSVPSGKLIVSDDLRPLYDFDTVGEGRSDYNSVAGQARATREMAEQGCAYGPVLNSSPSLIRTGEDRFIISHFDSELAPGEDGNPEGTELASICTDLWAYSIADYDDWLGKLTTWLAKPDLDDDNSYRLKELAEWMVNGANPADLPWTMPVVDVTPGVYRFTHHTGEKNFDHNDWPAVFAHVERIS
ncbi:hypothetical protein [Leifsonia sp. Leaf264]|uniref:hypothetical protein n=1 Tax=Leifsonia sp. Leaf264 TaxID=1736314 RepID=UPI0006FCF1E9|nr:hypothetical protein [Leifsonia sp. Leaf264]KQO98925.1 hypothetical protein ASF30_12765 [Leifsonia sp. Leaf264]